MPIIVRVTMSYRHVQNITSLQRGGQAQLELPFFLSVCSTYNCIFVKNILFVVTGRYTNFQQKQFLTVILNSFNCIIIDKTW